MLRCPREREHSIYEALGFTFAGDFDILRDGQLEATNYFFSLANQESVLELTFNHDGRTYELGTGYGHIAVGVDELERTLAELREQDIQPKREPYRVREGGSLICFVQDPDGNSVEAVHRPGRTESGPPIDHLWLGVADLEASRRFYESVAPALGLEVGDGRLPDMFGLAGEHRHAMFVHDGRTDREPSSRVPSPDRRGRRGFHHVATAAGYRDNGSPGERAEYHPGYVGAFVLDPDG